MWQLSTALYPSRVSALTPSNCNFGLVIAQGRGNGQAVSTLSTTLSCADVYKTFRQNCVLSSAFERDCKFVVSREIYLVVQYTIHNVAERVSTRVKRDRLRESKSWWASGHCILIKSSIRRQPSPGSFSLWYLYFVKDIALQCKTLMEVFACNEAENKNKTVG